MNDNLGKIWMRMGVTVEVDKELFLKNPDKAINEAIDNGRMSTDGDSYIPESILDEDRYSWAKPAIDEADLDVFVRHKVLIPKTDGIKGHE